MVQFNGNEAQGEFAIETMAEKSVQHGKIAIYVSGFFFFFFFTFWHQLIHFSCCELLFGQLTIFSLVGFCPALCTFSCFEGFIQNPSSLGFLLPPGWCSQKQEAHRVGSGENKSWDLSTWKRGKFRLDTGGEILPLRVVLKANFGLSNFPLFKAQVEFFRRFQLGLVCD